MAGDIGVISLDQDGVISKWTPNNQKHWQWVKLLDAGKEEAVDFAYMQDRIAVAFPRLGVKVWLWIKGTWQPQRSILRQNVTAIKFVEDGEALLGGTSDGVLWHCQVPNGTLRAYAFLKLQVHGLDVNSQGNQVLVSQSGGRAHLIGIQKSDNKGKVEQVYTTKDGEPNTDQRQNFTASFSSTGRTVLFGCTDNHVLVWDKNKGDVVCGLDHGEDETVQAVATFDHNSRIDSCQIVTGTKQGLLSWWKPPLVGN
ncbi:WD40-repeat-containing domain protein [Hygrophoropsis aurantiaca]|uniref:WD40-repeat-containing domain protein n=1 Tax=Hygrophoropsis aurantiaca TaxID=72124 RepID=A0ACB8AMW0_9AGAM|nr:WD40-repeat-containing domain protein [Hygrophoropsis aurantiaca]